METCSTLRCYIESVVSDFPFEIFFDKLCNSRECVLEDTLVDQSNQLIYVRWPGFGRQVLGTQGCSEGEAPARSLGACTSLQARQSTETSHR